MRSPVSWELMEQSSRLTPKSNKKTKLKNEKRKKGKGGEEGEEGEEGEGKRLLPLVPAIILDLALALVIPAHPEFAVIGIGIPDQRYDR